MSLSKKVAWIASQLPEYDADDIEDVLRENITHPSIMVAEVQMLSSDYDMEFERWSRKVSSLLGD